MELTNCVRISGDQWMSLSSSLLVSLARNLIMFLSEKQALTESFSFQSITYQTGIVKCEVMEAIAKFLKFSYDG